MNAVIDQIAHSLEKQDVDYAFHAVLSNDLILDYIMFENPDPKILSIFPALIENAVRNHHANSEWFLKAITSGLASIRGDGWYYGMNQICSFDSLQKQVLEGGQTPYDDSSSARLEIVFEFLEKNFYQLPFETKEWIIQYYETHDQESRSRRLMTSGPWLEGSSDDWQRAKLLDLLHLSDDGVLGSVASTKSKSLTSTELVLLQQLLKDSDILTGKNQVELIFESFLHETSQDFKGQVRSLLLKFHDKSNLLPIKSLAHFMSHEKDFNEILSFRSIFKIEFESIKPRQWIVYIEEEQDEIKKIQLVYNLVNLDLGLADKLLDETYTATIRPLMRGIMARLLNSKEDYVAKTIKWLFTTKKILSGQLLSDPWLPLNELEEALASIPFRAVRWTKNFESKLPAVIELCDLLDGKRADGTSTSQNVFLTLVNDATQEQFQDFGRFFLKTLVRMGAFYNVGQLYRNSHYRSFYDQSWATEVIVAILRDPTYLEHILADSSSYFNLFIDMGLREDFKAVIEAQEKTHGEVSSLTAVFRKVLVKRPDVIGNMFISKQPLIQNLAVKCLQELLFNNALVSKDFSSWIFSKKRLHLNWQIPSLRHPDTIHLTIAEFTDILPDPMSLLLGSTESDFVEYIVKIIPRLVDETEKDPLKRRELGKLGAKLLYYCYFKASEKKSIEPIMTSLKDSVQSPDLDAYFAVFKNDPQELLKSITQKMLETRFMDTFDISFFWDINMNLIKSNNFVPSLFVSNFDANRMRSMLVKVVHTLKDECSKYSRNGQVESHLTILNSRF